MLAEPLAVTLQVIDVLERLEAPYWIGGSLASALHGVARATLDSDLVANITLDQVEEIVRELEGSFFTDEEMVRNAVARHGSFNLIHRESMFKVDVFLLKERAFDRMQLERRAAQIVTIDPERKAYVCTAEDIILAKLEWYKAGGEVSERQWRDVMGVIKVQTGRLDIAYLRRWAEELDVLELLEEALSGLS
ncbi:MAG: hypothetical protein R3335_05580 [Anaerolineales bacterium]|nr:hypothetical protein [Anaerolineales bacterium]